MKSVLVLAVALLVSVTAFATDKNKDKTTKETTSVEVVREAKALQITGSVLDDKSNETLAGAAIFIDGQKYYSDLDGKFTVTHLKPGKHQIKVELISYETAVLEVDVEKDRSLNISLLQK